MRKLSLEELNRDSVEEFLQKEKRPLTIVLDNVRSGLNVGSAFRTADAFAVEKIWLCGITATPPHREILKTAIGATDTVEWEFSESTLNTVKKLKEEGYLVFAIEQTDQSRQLQEAVFQKDHKIALIFGNEVNGVSEEVLPFVDDAIEIPQFGTKHSLNISVCVGIVVWEVCRKTGI